MDTTAYFPEMYRYYSNIVAKYGQFVQKTITRFNDVKITYICSTHGPVWHDEVAKVVGIYDRLSKYEAEKGVVIAYASMYGNTEELAEAVARELSNNGIKQIKMYNLSFADLSFVLADICRYKGLIIGGPTYSNGLFPEVEKLLNAIKVREVKNRYFGCFGSGTWAPVVTKHIKAAVENLGIEVVGTPFDMKQSATPADIDNCSALAQAMAAKLNEE